MFHLLQHFTTDELIRHHLSD